MRQEQGVRNDGVALMRSEREQLTYQVKVLSAAEHDVLVKFEAAQQTLAAAHLVLAAHEKETQLANERAARAEHKADELEHEKLELAKQYASLQTQLRLSVTVQ